jgi:hypothetical protein
VNFLAIQPYYFIPSVIAPGPSKADTSAYPKKPEMSSLRHAGNEAGWLDDQED